MLHPKRSLVLLSIALMVACPLLMGVTCTSSNAIQDAEDAPRPEIRMFDGQSLDGWAGEPAWWSVEDGCIVGRTIEDEPLNHNTFLIWQGEPVRNFELHAEVLLIGDNNSGIQYRAAVLDEGFRTTGYQCDIHPNPPYTGMLYEEGGRGIVATQGSRVRIDSDGTRHEIESATEPIHFDLGEWRRFSVIARGNRLEHRIDDQITVVVEDYEQGRSAPTGAIALQLHSGTPYEVRFRNLRLIRLD